jgi:hypothetical protein
VEVLVLVLVLVIVLVAVGGRVVSVGGDCVGVDDGFGEGSIVALGMTSLSTAADVVGGPVLHPASIKLNSRIIKKYCLKCLMIGCISYSPGVDGLENYKPQKH